MNYRAHVLVTHWFTLSEPWRGPDVPPAVLCVERGEAEKRRFAPMRQLQVEMPTIFDCPTEVP